VAGNLYITEFADGARLQGEAGAMSFLQDPPVAEQKIAFGASSAQSAAFQPTTRYIRLQADNICSVIVGLNPTATATNRRLATGAIEYVGIPAGQSYKLAVIQNT
jgi:hypothetical protein